MNSIRFVLTLLCVLLFASCSTIPRYPDYTGQDRVTLCGHKDPNPFNRTPNVSVMAVDGIRTPGSGCKSAIALSPGWHEIDVFVSMLDSESFTVKPLLKSNKNYQIRGKIEDGQYAVYLFDVDTAETEDLYRIMKMRDIFQG